MRLTGKEIEAILRQHSYKLTPQRRVIIQTIASSQGHLTPTLIYEKVHQDYRNINIGLVTIYRTIEMLAKLKLICDLHAGGSCSSYIMSASGHHHHLICSNCGKTIDFTGCELGKVEQNLSRETGFKIEGHLLEFIGLCQACQKETT